MIVDTLYAILFILVATLIIAGPIIAIIIIFMVGPLRKYSGVKESGIRKKNLNLFQKIIRHCDEHQWKFIIYSLIFYLVILVLIDTTTVVGGNARYYGAVIRCRGAPYVYHSVLGEEDDVAAKDRRPVALLRYYDKYHCTVEKGYSEPSAGWF